MLSAKFTDTTHDDSDFANYDSMILGITREEVESGAIGKALSRLLLLSDQQQWVVKFEGRLSFVFFGYDNDSRELSEIAEVKIFMKHLVEEWPYWFHFLDRRGSQISTLLLLHCNVSLVRPVADVVGFEIDNANEFKTLLFKLFEGMNALHDCYGISEGINRRISTEVNSALHRMLG